MPLPPFSVRQAYDSLYREHWDDTIAQARAILRGYSDPADVAATAFTRLWAEVTGGRAEHLHERLTELVETAAECEIKREKREISYLGMPVDFVGYTDHSLDELYPQVIRIDGSHALDIARTVPPPTPETYRFDVEFDAAVRDLTPRQREAYALTELRGLSTVEAADVLGVTKQAVSAARSRARAAVADHLTQRGAR